MSASKPASRKPKNDPQAPPAASVGGALPKRRYAAVSTNVVLQAFPDAGQEFRTVEFDCDQFKDLLHAQRHDSPQCRERNLSGRHADPAGQFDHFLATIS